MSQKKKKPTQPSSKVQSVIARSDDGTIQITFTIPYQDIQNAENWALEELGKEIEIPGFRKGNAPLTKIKENISKNVLLEKLLSKILPKLVNEAIKNYKIKPSIYPKLELIKAQEGENWQIRATTCELPDIKLGNYKKEIAGMARAKAIWTPSSAKSSNVKTSDKEKELSREEKEQEVIKSLLAAIEVKIPKILIDEEVNEKLSKLLERLEKLGLSLESYLASIRKSAQDLRKEYEKQSRDSIAIELILNEIAKEENIHVDPKEVDTAIYSAGSDPKLAKSLDTPERKQFIEVILKRRKALDSLVAIIA